MGNQTRWKRALLLLAAFGAALLLTGAAATGYPAGTLQEITLSSPAEYVNQVTANDEKALAGAKAFLSTATKAARLPGNASQVAALTTLDAKGKQLEFTLLQSGDQYYLRQGSRVRAVTYADFNRMVNAIGSDRVYKYHAFPVGELTPDAPLDEAQSFEGGTYSYRRLSGSFSKVQIPTVSDWVGWVHQTTDSALTLPTFDRIPKDTTVTVLQGGKALWQGDWAQAKGYKLPKPGLYDVKVNLLGSNDWYRCDITYHYELEYSDKISLTVEGDNTHLGEVAVLRVTGTAKDAPLATFTSDISFNLPPKFHRREDGSQVALFPVSYLNKAGDHWVEIRWGDHSARYTISAKDKTWQRQDLDVSASTAAETVNSQRANAEYEAVIGPLRSMADSAQHWSGRFVLPVSDQKVTTQFGMVRYVNGAPTSSRHGAVDLAVPKGTPVKAAGGGRVLYAGFLQLTGNTVLIEHGYGLKTWYYHMDSLKVKTGDMVSQSQVIGAVGSTGFSTGPHLHFGMSVNNVSINPYTAIHTDLLDL